ncbi:MAG: uracil-DNA glycosylase [Patescibacteria group bacterium]
MTKKELLADLEQEMIKDTTLPLQEARLVFGEGNEDAEVLFIGEAPGFHEDRLGRPFVGRGGELLTECIGSIGWYREQVYITNIVKRRPPENRDPLSEEIEAYKPYLARQIEIIGPRIIVPLGRFAMNYFLPDAKISRDQGKIFVVGKYKVMPMFHPAAALRGTTVLNQFKETFTKLPMIVSGEVEVIKPEVTQTKKSSEEESSQVSLF